MAGLVGLAMPGGPSFVTALRRAWDDGDAVAPIDPRLSGSARAQVMDRLAPGTVIDEHGDSISQAAGRPVDPGDALVVATSGTTGDAKGVVLTHDAVAASATATSERLNVDPEQDRWLACLPLSHVGGLSVVTRAILTDTPVEVHAGFEAGAVAAAAASGSTMVSLVATALRRIDPTAFRTVLLGGARPPDDLPDNVVTTYGMTETGSGVVYDGRPLDGVEVRLDDGGVISIRAPMLLRTYRDGSDPKDEDGWFTTGDIGHWNGDHLVVDGRGDDLIITGGENVWPGPVEDLLRSHPDVVEVAVVGHEDPQWGERVVAHVVPRDQAAPPSLDDLATALSETLPPWYAPKELRLHRRLPRLGPGKIDRTRLLALTG